MDYYQQSWQRIQGDLIPWIVLFFVFSVLNSFTGGLAVLLTPNLLRVTRDALREERAPEIGELFEFGDISDDIVTMVLQYIANAVGLFFCGVGIFATMTLFFWAPMLSAEGEYGPVECMKASLAHSKTEFSDILVFFVIGVAINTAGLLLCCVGLFVTIPVTFVAGWLFFEANKDAILAAADAEGIPQKA